MSSEFLSAEDAAWLHMEHALSPMVVNGVLELGAPLTRERLRALVERLAQNPRFRSVVVEPERDVALPRWKHVEDFDVDHHLEHATLSDGSDETLAAFVGNVVSRRLDPSLPLFRIHAVDRPGHGTTLVFRVHHAIADGFALLGLMLSLCDDQPALHVTNGAIHPAVKVPTIRGAGAALRHLLTLAPDPETSLKGPLSSEKRVAWTPPIPLEVVREVARATGSTINDVLVSLVAGALGRHLARRGERTPGLELHALVPVNLRTTTATAALGNHFGLVLLGLPIGIDDPVGRVAASKQRMDVLKATPEAVVAHELLRVLGRSPRSVEDRVVSYFVKKTSLVLTNVPGPRVRLTLDGIPITRVTFWVPQAGRLGLGISVLSYAGEVTVGIIADACVVANPNTLASDVISELTSLVDEVRGERRDGPRLSPPEAWAAWARSLEPV